MACGIIWADRKAPRGVEVDMVCRELAIVTTKKKKKKAQMEHNQAMLIQLKGSHLFKGRIGDQWC